MIKVWNCSYWTYYRHCHIAVCSVFKDANVCSHSPEGCCVFYLSDVFLLNRERTILSESGKAECRVLRIWFCNLIKCNGDLCQFVSKSWRQAAELYLKTGPPNYPTQNATPNNKFGASIYLLAYHKHHENFSGHRPVYLRTNKPTFGNNNTAEDAGQ